MWVHFTVFGFGALFTFLVLWAIFSYVQKMDEGDGFYISGKRGRHLKHLGVTKSYIAKSIERRFGGGFHGEFDYEINEAGEIHRFLGPAVTTVHGQRWFFLNDIIMTEDEYWRTLLKQARGTDTEQEILAHMLTKGLQLK